MKFVMLTAVLLGIFGLGGCVAEIEDGPPYVAGPVVYDFRVQFYADATRTPIEDASVVWEEKDAPFLTVARLTLPRQDVSSPRGRRVAELCEGLSFDPWQAILKHSLDARNFVVVDE